MPFAARVARLLRGVRSTPHLGAFVLERRARRALLTVLFATLLAVISSSIAVLHFELPAGGNIDTAGDALWWAVVTVATVGYGDRIPTTPEGRLFGTLLMVTGVALFSVFTAYIATWFMEPETQERNRDLGAIHEELKEIRNELERER